LMKSLIVCSDSKILVEQFAVSSQSASEVKNVATFS
jgi:hypothetical protein